jgi:hypothetical protein
MPLSPEFERLLLEDALERFEPAAQVAAEALKENLSLGQRSGRQYPNLPNRSSAVGEFPQYQTGALYNSIAKRKTRDGYDVGSINNPPPEAVYLEFREPSRGGRPWLSSTLEDPETHRRINEAIR